MKIPLLKRVLANLLLLSPIALLIKTLIPTPILDPNALTIEKNGLNSPKAANALVPIYPTKVISTNEFKLPIINVIKIGKTNLFISFFGFSITLEFIMILQHIIYFYLLELYIILF